MTLFDGWCCFPVFPLSRFFFASFSLQVSPVPPLCSWGHRPLAAVVRAIFGSLPVAFRCEAGTRDVLRCSFCPEEEASRPQEATQEANQEATRFIENPSALCSTISLPNSFPSQKWER